LLENIIGNLLTPHVPVHKVLVTGVPEFHDDVVDDCREPWVANECESERVSLGVAVRAFIQRDDRV
jgi:hypothetical protein